MTTVTVRVLVLLLFGFGVSMSTQGQVVFENFDDGDVSDVFVFSETGGGIGVGTTEAPDGTPNAALSVGMNPVDAGSFAGFVITGGAGVTDVSSATYLTFRFRPSTVTAANLPLTLEINLHEDVDGNGTYEGGSEDEFQAVYRVATGAGYEFVQIPLASFGDDNAVFAGADDGFDFSKLLEIVVAVGGPQGPEFALAIDQIVFEPSATLLNDPLVEFDFFDDGDVSDVFVFSETGGGIGVGTTDDAGGTPNAALSIGINPVDAGSFAGFVISGGPGVVDISAAKHLEFKFRPSTITAANLPLVLEINLHEDVNGNGTYEGGSEDEFQAVYNVSTGSDYVDVVIPLASFADDNAVFAGANDGFDFSKLLEIVVAIGGPRGPEFAMAIDQVGTRSGTPVAVEERPSTESYSVSAAYPNPFVDGADLEISVSRPQQVRVEMFDLLGRSVGILFDDVVSAQAPQRVRLNGAGLASGLYFYRVVGETFVESKGIAIVR